MITIRKAGISDLKVMVPLFDAYRVFYNISSDPIGAAVFLTDRISKQESLIFIAVDEDGTPAGFTQLYPLFSSTRMKRLWLLNDLYVETNFRNKGVAKLLIERVKKHCHETNACGFFLETTTDNIPGNQLYPEVGMTLNENNFYYWDV